MKNDKVALFNKLMFKLSINLIVDAAYCDNKRLDGEAVLYSDGSINVYLADINDQSTLLHELVHAIQFRTGGFRFNVNQLRGWLTFHGIPVDEVFFREFLEYWRVSRYAPELLEYELLAHYCEQASNGYEAFKLLVAKSNV